MIPKIAQVVVGLPVEGPFDYFVDEKMQGSIVEGMRVYVPFGPRQRVGFVVGLAAKSSFNYLKPILFALDRVPALDRNALKLTKELSAYYGCSWGEAIECSLPAVLRTKKFLDLPPADANHKQEICSKEIIFCHDKGTTGRWPFIIERIKKILACGRGVVFLVPEKSMLAKVQKVLQKECDVPLSVLDKVLSAKQELEAWIKIRKGESRLVIGTRSAVFAPLPDAGLIVVYEEENPAYKQEQSPFYHVDEVADMRAKIEGATLAFITSSSSVELWWRIKKKKAQRRSFEADRLASLQLIDLSNYKSRRRATVSYPLSNHMEQTLTQGGKIVLLLNRLGFGTMARCAKCNHTVRCRRCDVNLSYFFARKKLICHLCNAPADLPSVCPQCHTAYMRYWGVGIEKMESEIARIFPQARVARFDRETKNIPPNVNILVGTQAVLRVLDQFQPQLIGMLNVDTELGRMDFRSAQRVFSLLIHLRQTARDKVFVQTYDPGHYCLQSVLKMDFEKFYKNEIRFRKEADLPPFSHLVAVGLRGTHKDAVFDQAKALYEKLQSGKGDHIEILDPQPDVMPKLRDKYRFTIMCKGKSLPAILTCIKSAIKIFKRKQNVIVTINVDP